MSSFQGELCVLVLRNGEPRGPEPVLIVAGRTVGSSKFTSVRVAMTVRTSLELQASIAACDRELWTMAPVACDFGMQSLQRKGCLRMSAKTDLSRQSRPANAGMAVLTSISELRFMHLRVAGNALRTRAGSCNVAFVVTSLALRLGVARREA